MTPIRHASRGTEVALELAVEVVEQPRAHVFGGAKGAQRVVLVELRDADRHHRADVPPAFAEPQFGLAAAPRESRAATDELRQGDLQQCQKARRTTDTMF